MTDFEDMVIPRCCDNQQIRTHDATGRPFCASCRRWLDRVQENVEEDEDGKPEKRPR
jgi:hypothetical protein